MKNLCQARRSVEIRLFQKLNIWTCWTKLEKNNQTKNKWNIYQTYCKPCKVQATTWGNGSWRSHCSWKEIKEATGSNERLLTAYRCLMYFIILPFLTPFKCSLASIWRIRPLLKRDGWSKRYKNLCENVKCIPLPLSAT